jgi:hypothetical protein
MTAWSGIDDVDTLSLLNRMRERKTQLLPKYPP